jgi:hypothetical protein
MPLMGLRTLFSYSSEGHDEVDVTNRSDEDPGTSSLGSRLNTSGLTVTIDYIEGLKEKESGELGHPRRRDPDHLPPSNLFEAICYQLRALLRRFYGGNTLFAIKAGTFSSIIYIPALIVSNLVTVQFSLLSHR